MGGRKSKVTGLGWVLVAACMAAAVAAADKHEGGGVMAGMCAATGFDEECGNGNMTEAKEFIREVFDNAVAELQIVIKNTSLYKKMETDHLTRGALDVCERVLADAIDELHMSFQKIAEFEIGHMDRSLDVVKIWLSAVITYKDTCFDAFAKTKGAGGSGRVVRQMLTKSGELLNKGLGMVIEFQKNFQSIKKDLEELVNSVKKTPRQLLDDSDDEIPDYVSDHARKLIENPKISLPPNAVVAQDGSGQFTTIMEAVNSVPLNNKKPFVIQVKAGVYKEYVVIPKKVEEVILVGEGPLKTRITGNRNYTGGVVTFDSATLAVDGRGFIAKDIGIENTAGSIGEQAVAVRTTGDVGIFYNVHIDGYQDTLYTHVHRQLFRECRISGTIDFIFGNSIAVFQKCELVARKPNPRQANMVTAQGRDNVNTTGITIIQGCNFTAEKELLEANPPMKTYLGRPWKDQSRTIIMHSTLGAFIDPEGWAPWKGDFGLDTLEYGEYNNYGPGADLSKRVTWKGILKITNDEEARAFIPLKHFVEDGWILDSGVPYSPVFM